MIYYILAFSVLCIIGGAYYWHHRKAKEKDDEMPAGLQIWDSTGKKIFDTTYSTTYALGNGYTGNSNGYLVDDRLSNGTGWIIVTRHYNVSIGTHMPVFSFNGNQLQWNFEGNPNPCDFIYGVY